ncbi:MAG TPA: response regulator transcription factor [Gemmatimonadaceae bacterium]|nr:response regulator transcription factor [Gemmatimonadaceae bacterium]
MTTTTSGREPTDVIRVILADDHAVVRAGLKAVLGVAKDILVVGEASNGRDAVAMAQRLDADVVVMDLSMPDMDGTAATKALSAAGARTRVLVLTMHAEDEYLVPLLEAGASGYLVKSAADRELVDAVRAVAHGDTYVQPSAARALARGMRRRDEHADDRTRFEKLTERERDVLRLVAAGYSAPEIGEKLFISPKTVDTYKQRIGEKLGLAHRSDYVQFALKLNLLTA